MKDDLISKQAAINAKQEFRNPNVIRDTESRTAYDRAYANGWNDCNKAWINAIEKLPSVQPRMSRWVRHDTGHSTYYDCYRCNCSAPCTETADSMLWKLSVYCPDCGAKMLNAVPHCIAEDLPSAQPQQVTGKLNSDCISRQEAIKELEELNAISFYELNEHSREAYREIKQMLKELPPAQTEQSVAQERYEDLCEYFGNDHDVIKTVLGDRKEFKAWLERLKWHVKECDKLSRQLEAQPEQKWIPCSKRLPEDEYVLISKKPTKISGGKWSVDIAIRTSDPRSRKIQWRDSGFGVIQDDKVLAWMPLPEPYRGGQE